MSTFPVIGEQVLMTGANDRPPTLGSSLASAEVRSDVQYYACSPPLPKRNDEEDEVGTQQRRLQESMTFKMMREKARIEADERFFREFFLERDKREQERAGKNRMELARGLAEAEERVRRQVLERDKRRLEEIQENISEEERELAEAEARFQAMTLENLRRRMEETKKLEGYLNHAATEAATQAAPLK